MQNPLTIWPGSVGQIIILASQLPRLGDSIIDIIRIRQAVPIAEHMRPYRKKEIFKHFANLCEFEIGELADGAAITSHECDDASIDRRNSVSEWYEHKQLVS